MRDPPCELAITRPDALTLCTRYLAPDDEPPTQVEETASQHANRPAPPVTGAPRLERRNSSGSVGSVFEQAGEAVDSFFGALMQRPPSRPSSRQGREDEQPRARSTSPMPQSQPVPRTEAGRENSGRLDSARSNMSDVNISNAPRAVPAASGSFRPGTPPMYPTTTSPSRPPLPPPARQSGPSPTRAGSPRLREKAAPADERVNADSAARAPSPSPSPLGASPPYMIVPDGRGGWHSVAVAARVSMPPPAGLGRRHLPPWPSRTPLPHHHHHHSTV